MATKPDLVLELGNERLWREGKVVPTKKKVFDLLRFFVRNEDRLLTKQAILEAVWRDTHVSDASIKDCVKNLRIALGDDADNPHFIETVRGRGYRYLGGIEVSDYVDPGDADAAIPDVGGPSETTAGKSRRGAFFAIVAVPLVLISAIAWFQALPVAPETSSRGDPLKPLPTDPSVVVLPFETLSADPDAALLSKGLTEDLTNALTRIPRVFVIASNTARAIGGQAVTANAIADELGVQYLLTGRVQKADNLLRITVNFTDARNGLNLWADRFERPAADFFAIQDEIVDRVLLEMRVTLTEGERMRAYQKDTTSLEARLLQMEGYGEFLKFTRQGNHRARDLWLSGLEADPESSALLASLAFTHFYDARRGWSEDRDTSVRTGMALAEQAIAKGPDFALGYQVLGALHVQIGDLEEGLALRRRSVALAPNDFSAVGGLAATLCEVGEEDEAVALFERALRLSPKPPLWVPVWYAHALHLAGRKEDAAAWLRKAISRSPDTAYLHARLAAVYADLDAMDEAKLETAETLRLDPDFSADALNKVFQFHDPARRDWLTQLMTKAGFPHSAG